MASQSLTGRGVWLADLGGNGLFDLISNGGFNSTFVIDATGEKIAMMGRVWFPDRTGTKDISRLGWRFGAVTKSGGSSIIGSLQTVSAASGPPGQPDEVQDQTVTIANGNAAFASNTWIRTDALSANRTVSYGEMLAVVVEYDGSGRLGADSVVVSGFASSVQWANASVAAALKTGGTWANAAVFPMVVLEFSDGTFGTLDTALPATAFNTHANNSGATPDEYAMPFTVPFACSCDGLGGVFSVTNSSSDFELVLYEGTTPLQTVTVDATQLRAAGVQARVAVPIPATTLSPGTQYYAAVKPTTANNVSAYSVDVNDANHLTCWPGGTPLAYTTRTDAGAWAAATATRRLMVDVRLSAFDDGAGGAGGGLLRPVGLSGGLV
jgi:hypothetical protein